MTAQPLAEPTTRQAPFGSVPAPVMAVARTVDGGFGDLRVGALEPLAIHPFSHALHYGSVCFEGLKAHRGVDGVVRLFRADVHVDRLRRSAQLLHLPVPSEALLSEAIMRTVEENLDVVPDPPGALYLRPLLFGTDENIGAASTPTRDACLVVVASPVGDYFAVGQRPLRLAVETHLPRTTPQLGEAKTPANYAMALGLIQEARTRLGVDQVLFAPDGDVQETGASNFLLLDDRRVVTKALDSSFLHGVTRDAVLTLAGDLGYEVEERDIHLDELESWCGHGEAALSGTAAVLSAVGSLVVGGSTLTVGDGEVGPNTRRLRDALLAVQRGQAPDHHGWTTPVGG